MQISCVYIIQCKMVSNMATSRNYKINLVDLEMNLLYLYLVKAAINCVEMNTSLFYKPKLLVCFTSIGIFLLLNFKRLELDISISFTFKNLPWLNTESHYINIKKTANIAIEGYLGIWLGRIWSFSFKSLNSSNSIKCWKTKSFACLF